MLLNLRMPSLCTELMSVDLQLFYFFSSFTFNLHLVLKVQSEASEHIQRNTNEYSANNVQELRGRRSGQGSTGNVSISGLHVYCHYAVNEQNDCKIDTISSF